MANCVGGMKNMINHTVNGILVENNDTKLYVQYIKDIKNGSIDYRKITINAYNELYYKMNKELAYDRQMGFYSKPFKSRIENK